MHSGTLVIVPMRYWFLSSAMRYDRGEQRQHPGNSGRAVGRLWSEKKFANLRVIPSQRPRQQNLEPQSPVGVCVCLCAGITHDDCINFTQGWCNLALPSHSVHNYFQLFRISVDSPYPFSRESHYQSHCGRSQTSLAIVVYVCCEPSITLPSDRLPLTPHGHPMRPRAASGARAPPEGGHRRAGGQIKQIYKYITNTTANRVWSANFRDQCARGCQLPEMKRFRPRK